MMYRKHSIASSLHQPNCLTHTAHVKQMPTNSCLKLAAIYI